MGSIVFSWVHFDPYGFTKVHLGSLGFTLVQLEMRDYGV